MNKNERGLTMIEMIVVISILGLMVGIAVPYFSQFRDDGMKRRQKEQFARIKEAYELFSRVHFAAGSSPTDTTYYLKPTENVDGQSIVDYSVLNGGAGVSYLSSWDPGDFKTPAGISPSSKNMYSVWGDPIGLALGGNEMVVNVSGQVDNTMSDYLPGGSAELVEAQLRAEVVGRALLNYWKDYTKTSGLTHPKDFTLKMLQDPNGPLKNYLGTDLRWYSGYIYEADKAKNPDYYTGDWLKVRPDISQL